MRLTNQVIKLRNKLISRKKELQAEHDRAKDSIYLTMEEKETNRNIRMNTQTSVWLIDDILLDIDLIH
jgi:hypothetical protein